MSIALLEAMALGIPIVASSIPGNQRLIEDGEHGRLVSPEDPVCLASAIIEQWQSFDTATGLGIAAHAGKTRILDRVGRPSTPGTVS